MVLYPYRPIVEVSEASDQSIKMVIIASLEKCLQIVMKHDL
jgi:hypothetical protein